MNHGEELTWLTKEWAEISYRGGPQENLSFLLVRSLKRIDLIDS
jgi:hypothetical protein